MGEGGFEPPKAMLTDLQSAPFGHSGIPPYEVVLSKVGAGRRTRTPDLLITNQLLYQLSYTSGSTSMIDYTHGGFFCQGFFEKIFPLGKRSGKKGRNGENSDSFFTLRQIQMRYNQQKIKNFCFSIVSFPKY